LVGTRADW
jgi:xanthosine utilization system XapX-like protein